MIDPSPIGEGERKGRLNWWPLKSAAGIDIWFALGAVVGCAGKNPGLANSDGDVAVADTGICRKSMPYPADVSICRLGPIGCMGCCGMGWNIC